MKKKLERISVLLLATMILAVTIETAETRWTTDLNDQNWNFEKVREWSDFAHINENSAELVIGLTKGKDDTYTRLDHLIALNGGKIVKTISTKKEIMAIIAEIPFDLIPSFVLKVKATGLTEYIEPNLRVRIESLPNDPYWSLQWGPQKIEADWAWNATFGDPSILVAVIDTGIDYNHPDLTANYVALGYDWADDDEDPMDDWSHGTHVAGIIAAVINNEIGIAGLAQARVMAEKVFNKEGEGYVDWVADGILHATEQGAKIISMSLSADENSSLLYDAVKYAYDSDVLLVAAAGNYANDTKRYPAAYDEVIAVTSTNQSDLRAFSSSFGDWVELAAPGVRIYSTVRGNGYYYWSGTSFACPHVSGVAALAWSRFPNATRDWVRSRLRDTTDDLGNPGFDNYYGYGRINARKAIYGTSPAINYTLAITTTAGGTTNPLPGNHTYSQGQIASVQATPNTGYGLDHWKFNEVNVGSANPYSVLMDNNHTLHGVFVPAYILTITTTTGGTTNPSPDSYFYNAGTNVLITAITDTYYNFDHWELDEVNIGPDNPYSVLMDNDHLLQAIFAPITYSFLITATTNGTTDPGPGFYNLTAGSNIEVSALPDTNYVLKYWELDGINIGTTNPLILFIERNHTLKAAFRLSVFDIAVTDISPSKTVIGQGCFVFINVTVVNRGDYPETFDVTLYVGDWNENRTIYLPNGTSTILTFTCNTSDFTKGNYTISAVAEPVPSEINTEDNTLDGWIFITILGDVNGDSKVDITDITMTIAAYGKTLRDPGWSELSTWYANCDVNDDNKIDISDITTVIAQYGKKW